MLLYHVSKKKSTHFNIFFYFNKNHAKPSYSPITFRNTTNPKSHLSATPIQCISKPFSTCRHTLSQIVRNKKLAIFIKPSYNLIIIQCSDTKVFCITNQVKPIHSPFDSFVENPQKIRVTSLVSTRLIEVNRNEYI